MLELPKMLREFVCYRDPNFKEQIDLQPNEARFVRGFFGQLCPSLHEFHQHVSFGEIFLHPVIQYKILDGHAVVVGLQKGSYLLEKIKVPAVVRFGSEQYYIKEVENSRKIVFIGVTQQQLQYTFLSPWLPLNQRNYLHYRKILRENKDPSELLSRMLVGNLLSMAKGFFYRISEEIKASCTVHSIGSCLIKEDEPRLGFRGEFSVNFQIPDYWGIGKSPSLGFGTVVEKISLEE